MRKIYLLLIITIVFASNVTAVNVTVTNPGNTTPALAASYTSLALAITALNGITAISGPVILTCAAGPETAPAGGYSINFTAITTAANNIVITGTATTTITASAALTAGSLTDAIFKIIGSDYVTIKNFTMLENGANTTTAAATNNMTEWGVALLHASVTNGAQNNTIQNNIITLNRSYSNSFGIYSNARHSATVVGTLEEIINSTTGPNSGNAVASNTIRDVNMGIAFIGPGADGYQDQNNYVGYSVATGNTISNWGGTAAASPFYSNSPTSYCIYCSNQLNEKISYNTITSAAVSGAAVAFRGIFKDFSFGAVPTSTFTSSINNNTITMSSSLTYSGLTPYEMIRSQGASGGVGTISITANTILNCAYTGTPSQTTMIGIINGSAVDVLSITNNILRGNTSTATIGGFTGISNVGPVVTTININNNQLGNAAGGAITFAAATSGQINCINNSAGDPLATLNINNNSFDGISVTTSGTVRAILNTAAIGVAININNNLLGTTTGTFVTTNGVQTNSIVGIFNTSATTTTAVSIQNNDIRGIVHTAGATCTHQYIASLSGPLTNIVSNNTFTNLSVNTSGTVTFITKSGTMASGASATINNNSIVGTFTKTASSGTVTVYDGGTASLAGSTLTISGNNFSNITVSGTSNVNGIFDNDGSVFDAPSKTISGNTFNNISLGTGTFTGIFVASGLGIGITSNTISNVTGGGPIIGINPGSGIGAGTCSISSNTINSFTSTGGNLYGIYGGSANSTTLNINSNNINNLSAGGASATVVGISLYSGQTNNIYDNVINALSGSGGLFSICNGIEISGGATINIYRNRLYSFTETAAGLFNQPSVNGILISNSTGIATVYNNFVSDLNVPNASLSEAIRGININSSTANTTYNLYYNSVYLNAVSSAAIFGTCGIHHLGNATATTANLNMIDNIIVNTSIPKGGGQTVAYWRGNILLNNYASTSDYNNFYAGTPGPANLIFYDNGNADQTLAAYQTRVSPRDANSISVLPVFTSATDLHITTANCDLDNKGIPIIGFTSDIDLTVRNISTPDIGGDEFTAGAGILAGAIGGHASQVCVSKAVGTGSFYTTPACDLVARIVPSGVSPVSGTINTCVTIQPLSPFPTFNAEPYVQRYYDITPVTNPLTSTATITLYFKDQEFIDFNANNPGWPDLPTSVLGNTDPNRANLRVTQYHGTAVTPWGPGNYTSPGTPVLLNPGSSNVYWNATNSRWEVTVSVTGFSGFYVHTNLYYPLAVNVNYFRGTKQGSDHLLDWKLTCNTTPRVTMTLERSASASGPFAGIHSLTADAVRCNQPFSYTDAQPLKGMNYYRLKMVDADGKISYSSIVALLNATKGYEFVNIVPNPVTANGVFKLNVSSAQVAKMDIVISDLQSRVVNRQTLSLIAGFNSIDMNVANLAAGTYNISGITPDDKSRVIRFVKL